MGKSPRMPDWTPRDTARARELRNAATAAERHLWRYLSRGQLGAKFSRQMQIGRLYADFLCRELSLVIEIDGFSHDLDPDYDRRRDRWLEGQGYTVLHFSNEEVLGNTEGVCLAIGEAINRLRAVRGRTAGRVLGDERFWSLGWAG